MSTAQDKIGIGLFVNSYKTEYMCFKQVGAISILKSKPLKLVDQLTYFDSNISSTDSDVKIHIRKAWTAIELNRSFSKMYP